MKKKERLKIMKVDDGYDEYIVVDREIYEDEVEEDGVCY